MRKNPMMPLGHKALLPLAALSFVAQFGCPAEPATSVTCGTGTKLNAEGTQCIPTSSGGGFNVVVDDFSLGEFEMTNVDAPEQMQPGFADERTFTITNTGDEDQEVVYISVNLVPVEAIIDEVREEIEYLDSPRSCDEETLECTVSTRCNPAQGICELKTFPIGGVMIENLAAGESRDIVHELKLPASWTEPDGVYGLVFAINEVALEANDDGEVRLEDRQPEAADGEQRLATAAAVHAPATVIVGLPDKPNLRILYANGSEGAFELENYAASPAAILDLTARISAQGKDAVAPLRARFELALPGHEISVPGQDLGEAYFDLNGLDFANAPEATTYVYNPERTFPLYFGSARPFGDSLNPEVAFETEYVKDVDCVEYEVEGNECLRELSVENDVGLDVIGALTLSIEAQRLLAQTPSLDTSLNPDLDDNGEILGAVRMTIFPGEDEYEVNGEPLVADNVIEIPLIFMAPEAEPDASPDDLPEGGLPDAGTGGGMDGQSINAPCCGPYTDAVENVTPHKYSSFGSEWLGGSYQLKNDTTRKIVAGATVAKRTEADNYVKGQLLKGEFDIVGVYGHIDVGTQRPLADNRVHGRMTYFGSTLFDASFNSLNCSSDDPVFVTYKGETTSGPVETCLIIETEGSVSRPPQKREDPTAGREKTEPRKREWFTKWEPEPYRFQAGPVPLMIKAEAGFGSGLVAGAYLIRDESAPQVFTGLQFGLGPFANLSATLFGGVSIGVARAGVEGSATLLRVEFKPTLNFGISQQLAAGGNCWNENAGKISFDGPITGIGLDGNVSVVAYAGVKGCAAWICVDAETKVFDYSFANIRGVTYTYKLWDAVKLLPQGGQMCTTDTEVWSSPKSCSWFSRYCNNSVGLFNYSRTFNLPANGAKLEITGETEYRYDFLRIYDDNGNQIRAYSGRMPGVVPDITGTSSITLRLFSDYSVNKSGVSVKVTPH